MNDIRCTDCNALLKKKDLTNDKCWKCEKSPIKEIVEQQIAEKENDNNANDGINEILAINDDINNESGKYAVSTTVKDYPTLRLISVIYKIFAWIVGIGSGIALFYGLSLLDNSYEKDFGVLIIVYSLISGFLGVIFSLAISEGIILFVNIANDVNDLKNNRENK